ncbi:hypothetical protein CRG98_048824, partial [Punica granatum]
MALVTGTGVLDDEHWWRWSRARACWMTGAGGAGDGH